MLTDGLRFLIPEQATSRGSEFMTLKNFEVA